MTKDLNIIDKNYSITKALETLSLVENKCLVVLDKKDFVIVL